MMKKPIADDTSPQPFRQLTAERFLNMFVEQAGRMADGATCDALPAFIQKVVLSSSNLLEQNYRNQLQISGQLTREQYAELIVELKNAIGGKFYINEMNDNQIFLFTDRCPFGDIVENAPGLCHMTSSIFGGIAARNFGYAKVELKKRIALGSGHCEICIHSDPAKAEDVIGDEYFSDGHQVIAEVCAPSDVQKRIEERLHALWQRERPCQPSGKLEEAPTLVAQSPAMLKLLDSIETVAPTRVTVLLSGETGVGKEMMAKAIHCMSPRRNEPFIAVNCGSIPSELVESELFGHESGAFTDAKTLRLGKFERANGGTLFLDEADCLSPRAQMALLRVLQEQRFERVGGQVAIACDVRVIAATNQNLVELISQNKFREDLYYRLNVISLTIPPLRERKDDIPALTECLLDRFQKRYSKEKRRITQAGMQSLIDYSWWGNVRELENVLERSYLFARDNLIDHILFDLDYSGSGSKLDDVVDLKYLKQKAADDVEKQILSQALRKHKGKVAKVAESIGLTPRAIYQKLKQHQLDVSNYKRD